MGGTDQIVFEVAHKTFERMHGIKIKESKQKNHLMIFFKIDIWPTVVLYVSLLAFIGFIYVKLKVF